MEDEEDLPLCPACNRTYATTRYLGLCRDCADEEDETEEPRAAPE